MTSSRTFEAGRRGANPEDWWSPQQRAYSHEVKRFLVVHQLGEALGGEAAPRAMVVRFEGPLGNVRCTPRQKRRRAKARAKRVHPLEAAVAGPPG
jgi:hypothetical protein